LQQQATFQHYNESLPMTWQGTGRVLARFPQEASPMSGGQGSFKPF